jgi:YfiH family protein
VDESWGGALRAAALEGVATHLFTTRQLRLRGDGEEEQWALVAEAVGVPAQRLVRLRQVHGTSVFALRRGEAMEVPRKGLAEADIVMTDDAAIAVSVQVADCVPVLLADREGRAVAAVHAGWRGSCARAASKAVRAIEQSFGVKPSDLVAVLGPSIGPCCYEVGSDVVDSFGGEPGEQARWFRRDGGGGWRLDLWAANIDQLVAAGVPPGSVHLSSLCTSCRGDLFHSYRRDGPGTGRIAAVIRCR